VYTSLGSSAWIALTSKTPALDLNTRPFIFAHAEKGYYTSGVSIFAAGRAYRWAAEELCQDLPPHAARYEAMDALAAQEAPGAGGVLFNPSLSGGSSQEPGPALRGAFAGITLGTTRGRLLRSVLEGVALSLSAYCLSALQQKAPVGGEMLLCGGGAKSPLWNQIFADVFGMDIVRTGVEENAASLGAAAMALRAGGVWADYSRLENLYPIVERYRPDERNHALYTELKAVFREWNAANLAIFQKITETTTV
jgi:sugar (pentulose or hexulose) kinase